MAGNGKSLFHSHLRTEKEPQSQRKPFLFTDSGELWKLGPRQVRSFSSYAKSPNRKSPGRSLPITGTKRGGRSRLEGLDWKSSAGWREDNNIKTCSFYMGLQSEATRPLFHQQTSCVTTLPLRQIQIFFLYGDFLLCLLEGDKRQSKLEETLLLFVVFFFFFFQCQGLYPGYHAHHQATPPPPPTLLAWPVAELHLPALCSHCRVNIDCVSV